MFHLRNILLLVAAIGIVSCSAPTATNSPPSKPTAAASAAYSDNDVTHAVVLDLIESRLKLGLAAWQSGNYDLAKRLVNVSGLFDNYLAPALSAQNADAPLKNALVAYTPLLEKAGNEAQIKDAHTTVLAAVSSSRQSLVGAQLGMPKFQAEVISRLMVWISDTYSRNPGLTGADLQYAYQRAFGYFDAAKARYLAIASNAQDSGDLSKQFATLDTVFPDAAKTPASLADAPKVTAATVAIQTDLQQAFGLSAQASSTSQFLDNTQRGTLAGLDLYKAGKNKEAYEALVDAYLNGFEFIEGDLDKKDMKFRQELEGKLGDMRNAVKAGKPVGDVEALAKDIAQGLATASDLLAGKAVAVPSSAPTQAVAPAAASNKNLTYLIETRSNVAAAVAKYKQGQVDDAYELAVKSYIEGFENVETDLTKKDSKLLGDMEGQFKLFRDSIKAKKSAVEIEALAKTINDGLDKVQALLK